ncbi:MAG: adenylosuccinate lyase [Flavobacteriales bacterium]|nr:adenylosuccinate lyase [Flavobacteriales bacterium]
MNNSLNNISPIDGRYSKLTKDLTNYFSESALIKYRVYIEIAYFISLCKLRLKELKNISKKDITQIKKIASKINIQDINRIKEIEAITNHDVKAVEYFIKEKFDKLNLIDEKEFIHFGLTSQDINNTATPLLLMDGLNNSLYPELNSLIKILYDLSKKWKQITMLARTHGQPASPTKLGKEISVFKVRIQEQLNQLLKVPHSAKFGGATGNLNAHYASYPKIDWHKFAKEFLRDIGLKRSYPTTQIEHYDNLAAQLDAIKRINTILIDLCRDIWIYISMNYFNQKISKNEVGSSAMPHKVNPIDFENAEGNLGVANALFTHLSEKLPISRLQRDLSDSTVMRNLGVPIAHSIISYKAIIKGLNKLIVNHAKINEELNENWAIISEAIQTILRREGIKNPYEKLKELTRQNEKIREEDIVNFIDSLELSEKIKKELKQINPTNYTGKS